MSFKTYPVIHHLPYSRWINFDPDKCFLLPLYLLGVMVPTRFTRVYILNHFKPFQSLSIPFNPFESFSIVFNPFQSCPIRLRSIPTARRTEKKGGPGGGTSPRYKSAQRYAANQIFYFRRLKDIRSEWWARATL